jgi:predicted ATPase
VERDLAAFREAVRARRRAAGRTQQQLARGVGVHPDVLSHKLYARGAVLTSADVTAIVTTLAGWGAVGSQAEARSLLALMAVPAQAVPPGTWAGGPLGTLPSGDLDQPPAGPPGSQPGPGPAGGRLSPVPLPWMATSLVGRAAEVAAVAAAVAEYRLVTLTGTGGTGKTRVAVQAARELAGRFAGGVAFADLAPVGDPGLLAVSLARAVGLTPQSAATAEGQLAAALGPAQVLLVADNMEHLIEQAPLLGRLLAAVPGLHLLVTSRVGLGLYGEYQLRVPPLRLPEGGPAADSEAVQLFVQRAGAVVPGFDPRGEALAAVAAICSALDGLPLAIELAAARVRLYPPQALLSQLAARLPVLTGGPRDLPARQRTLRATFDWSDALLSGEARDLFAQVGVFAGPFDAAAAAAVCAAADPVAMTGRLAELAGHSLLEVAPGPVPRFGLLATVREYALARLAETGQADAARDRHLDHYLALATQARTHLAGQRQGSWFDRLAADSANIRAALDWARDRAEADGRQLDDGLRLATAAARFWRHRGSTAEGALHLERLLALEARHHTAAPATRAGAVLEASGLACYRGDYPATAELAGQGLELYSALGDLPGQARAHRWLGEAALALGDLTTAEPHFHRQLKLAGQARDRPAEAKAVHLLSQVSRYQGRYREATAQLRRAQQAFQAAGDPDGAATVITCGLGEVARDAGKPDRARDLFRQALRGAQQAGSERLMAYTLEGLATVAAMTGDGRAALTYLGAAQALREHSSGPIMPVDQAILGRFLDPGLAALTPRQREQALAEGRNRPLAQIIDQALTR